MQWNLEKFEPKKYHTVKNSGCYWIERTSKSTVDETVRKVDRHFGFVKLECFQQAETSKF